MDPKELLEMLRRQLQEDISVRADATNVPQYRGSGEQSMIPRYGEAILGGIMDPVGAFTDGADGLQRLLTGVGSGAGAVAGRGEATDVTGDDLLQGAGLIGDLFGLGLGTARRAGRHGMNALGAGHQAARRIGGVVGVEDAVRLGGKGLKANNQLLRRMLDAPPGSMAMRNKIRDMNAMLLAGQPNWRSATEEMKKGFSYALENRALRKADNKVLKAHGVKFANKKRPFEMIKNEAGVSVPIRTPEDLLRVVNRKAIPKEEAIVLAESTLDTFNARKFLYEFDAQDSWLNTTGYRRGDKITLENAKKMIAQIRSDYLAEARNKKLYDGIQKGGNRSLQDIDREYSHAAFSTQQSAGAEEAMEYMRRYGLTDPELDPRVRIIKSMISSDSSRPVRSVGNEMMDAIDADYYDMSSRGYRGPAIERN